MCVCPGTGIAAVQGLSALTNADTVFIQRQERITKAFLSATTAVNGICTRSYPHIRRRRRHTVADTSSPPFY